MATSAVATWVGMIAALVVGTTTVVAAAVVGKARAAIAIAAIATAATAVLCSVPGLQARVSANATRMFWCGDRGKFWHPLRHCLHPKHATHLQAVAYAHCRGTVASQSPVPRSRWARVAFYTVADPAARAVTSASTRTTATATAARPRSVVTAVALAA